MSDSRKGKGGLFEIVGACDRKENIAFREFVYVTWNLIAIWQSQMTWSKEEQCRAQQF